MGCQYDLLVKENRIVGVDAAPGSPTNEGLLCVKGRFGSYQFVHSGDRLKHPLIKENGAFRRASWDEALDLVASRMKGIQEQYGRDSVGGFSCSRATNEDNYAFQKLMRAGLGTNNVDNCARVCHSASVHGLATTLGSGAMTNPMADITEDVDVILLVGSNPTEAHPVMGARIRRAVRRGTKLIVVDPRKIDLTEGCALHLQIKPGTNVAFANGMLNVILSEGLEDRDFIQNRTEGFEALREIVAEYTPERVGEICHIDPDGLRAAARMYAAARKAPIIYCLGVTELLRHRGSHGPVQPGHGRGQAGPLRLRRESPPGPEQRPGRLRHGRSSLPVPRISEGHRPRRPGEVREGLGPAPLPQ